MRIPSTIIVTALVLALSGVAQAGQLVTPALAAHGESVRCYAVNLKTKAVDIDVKIFKDGAGLSGWTQCNSWPAGRVCKNTLAGATGLYYCKITSKGGKGKIRGSLCVAPDAVSSCAAALAAY